MESKTTSSLALLDEIKVLAKASEDIKPIAKTNNTIAAGEKKKVTLELSFALDEIKNSISQAASSEESEIQKNKKKEETQRELEKKQAESSEALRIANEIAQAEASQKALDRERHIEQLRIQYQAACALDPNAPKPQELQDIDDAIAAQKLAEAKIKQAEEEKIAKALKAQKDAAVAKRKKEQAEKRKLILSVSGALVTVAAGFAFFVMSTPEEPKVQQNLAPVVTEFKQSEAEAARMKKMQEDAALRKKIEEDAARNAELAALEKQKEEEEKKRATRKPVTGGDKGNEKKDKKGKGFSIGLDGF
jgi:hypothetical protein